MCVGILTKKKYVYGTKYYLMQKWIIRGSQHSFSCCASLYEKKIKTKKGHTSYRKLWSSHQVSSNIRSAGAQKYFWYNSSIGNNSGRSMFLVRWWSYHRILRLFFFFFSNLFWIMHPQLLIWVPYPKKNSMIWVVIIGWDHVTF